MVCLAAGVFAARGQSGTTSAEQQQQGAARETVTLRPVDTGRSVVSFTVGDGVQSARLAVKTNLLYAAAAMTPNIGLEYGIGTHTTIGLAAGLNRWGNLWDFSKTGPTYDPANTYKRRLDHTYGKVEARYWFERRFEGHSVGINAFYAGFHAGELKLPQIFDCRRDYDDGSVWGGALTYGWLWRWNRHWGMEFSLGVGVATLQYEVKAIEAAENGVALTGARRFRRTYVTPTNLGVSMVFTM